MPHTTQRHTIIAACGLAVFFSKLFCLDRLRVHLEKWRRTQKELRAALAWETFKKRPLDTLSSTDLDPFFHVTSDRHIHS